MGFADAIKTCLRKYVTFSGRASRSEYWWFALFTILGGAVLGAVDMAIFGVAETVRLVPDGDSGLETEIVERDYLRGPISNFFRLLTALPLLAAGWRRLHDTGRPGWWLLVPMAIAAAVIAAETLTGALAVGVAGSLVALAAAIFVIVQLARRGDAGSNAFGPNPTKVSR